MENYNSYLDLNKQSANMADYGQNICHVCIAIGRVDLCSNNFKKVNFPKMFHIRYIYPTFFQLI